MGLPLPTYAPVRGAGTTRPRSGAGRVHRDQAAPSRASGRAAGVVADRAPGPARVGRAAGDGGRVDGRFSRARARRQGPAWQVFVTSRGPRPTRPRAVPGD